MKVVILLFEDHTALDAIGPYEVLSRVPGWEIQFVAQTAGPQRTDSGETSIEATASIDQVGSADILLIPGGPGTRPQLEDEPLLDWVRKVSATAKWITSVCTGSLVLAAAGLLEGKRATTHWLSLERLAEYGAIPTSERVVFEDPIVTAAGVSSGIDMALALVGREVAPQLAEAMQLAIEYDPQPPYDSGSPHKAAPEIIDVVTQGAAQRDPWLAGRLDR